MGNIKQPSAEKKRKKKGRPSLLDLQKRTLRLQKQQQAHSNPNFPDADDSSDCGGGSHRQKKLKHVLSLSDSDAGGNNRGNKTDRGDLSTGTDGHQEAETSDSGHTTPLPDEKLLVFILDRLQKKDTYRVFSKPVDPNELPDYHEIIEHPMDFTTVRKKLCTGAYANLEQFEKDVFLISSNAMQYNAPSTIYYRQARSIQELARKNFENLRQESDDNEPEPKPVPRRGRPPSKSAISRPVGRPLSENAALDSSDATLTNGGDNDLLRKGSASDKPGLAGIYTRSSMGHQGTETFGWMGGYKSDKREGNTGCGLKGMSLRHGKISLVIDENRRETYKQPQLLSSAGESPLARFDGERKQLVPVGLHMEHAYARSLARFAANLGPIGWEIAAKKIESALPRGTQFGHGWAGDTEAPKQSQPPLSSTSPPHPSSLPKISPYSMLSRGDQLPLVLEPPPREIDVEEGHISSTLPPAVSTHSHEPSDSACGIEPVALCNCESGSHLMGGSTNQPTSLQLQQNSGMQPTINSLNTSFGFDLASQLAKMGRPTINPSSFHTETPMTHGRALDMVSGGNSFVYQRPTFNLDDGRVTATGNSSTLSYSGSRTDPSHDTQSIWRGLTLQQKPDSVTPNINVQFQPLGLPISGATVDTQQPDLALQL